MGVEGLDRSATPRAEVHRVNPTVSVVIPTCDRIDLLSRAVVSVIMQTFADFEIIVVDDGTRQRVPEGYYDDERISVVRSPSPKGPGAARNLGIDAARGEFVAFLDDDDHWLPEKLAVSVDALSRHPDAGVLFHDTGRPGHRISTSRIEHVHRRPVVVFGTRQTPHIDSVLIRVDVLGDLRFSEDLPAAAEVDLLLHLSSRCPFVELEGTYAIFDPSPVAPSGISLGARIAARRRIMATHPEVFESRAARSFGMSRLGYLYNRSGDHMPAIRCFVNAIWLDPTLSTAWRGIASTVIGPHRRRRSS